MSAPIVVEAPEFKREADSPAEEEGFELPAPP